MEAAHIQKDIPYHTCLTKNHIMWNTYVHIQVWLIQNRWYFETEYHYSRFIDYWNPFYVVTRRTGFWTTYLSVSKFLVLKIEACTITPCFKQYWELNPDINDRQALYSLAYIYPQLEAQVSCTLDTKKAYILGCKCIVYYLYQRSRMGFFCLCILMSDDAVYHHVKMQWSRRMNFLEGWGRRVMSVLSCLFFLGVIYRSYVSVSSMPGKDLTEVFGDVSTSPKWLIINPIILTMKTDKRTAAGFIITVKWLVLIICQDASNTCRC